MKKYPLWVFILLPATAMLLGWGLRGFIGGGPFGAMIPGAMLMITICMLLRIPTATAGVMVVFATAGIGMGGEMTYGQTLGFLRNPETIWWGTCGTTVKGGVWGLVGGVFIGLGLVHKRIGSKLLITGFIIFLLAFVTGLKLINDPKFIYFSNPLNKPRQESWAGLLFAGLALLGWLKLTLLPEQCRLVIRFASYGLLGGALGFGLGGCWLVVGSLLTRHSWITDWWKLMEFTFGMIMGGCFGYAAWLSRNGFANAGTAQQEELSLNGAWQFLIVAITGTLIYLLIPILSPFADGATANDAIATSIFRTIARVLTSYTFMGVILVLIAIRWPGAAFQLAVTLTFSHTVIDLVEDMEEKGIVPLSPLTAMTIILLATAIVAMLVSAFQLRQLAVKRMLLLLVWSTVTVAILRMALYSQFEIKAGHSLLQFVVADMMVCNIFTASALLISAWAASTGQRPGRL